MPAAGFVYILTNKPYEYPLTRLVYFEEYPTYADAIRRETNLKRWKRQWKIALIDKANPEWKALIETWRQ